MSEKIERLPRSMPRAAKVFLHRNSIVVASLMSGSLTAFQTLMSENVSDDALGAEVRKHIDNFSPVLRLPIGKQKDIYAWWDRDHVLAEVDVVEEDDKWDVSTLVYTRDSENFLTAHRSVSRPGTCEELGRVVKLLLEARHYIRALEKDWAQNQPYSAARD